MQERPFWLSWARWLKRWGVDQAIADLLELAGPLSLFLAQALYAGQPFLASVLPGGHWRALAELCEDQETRLSFVTLLRQEGNG